MTLGQVLAGNIIYADDVQDEIDYLAGLVAYKSADTSRNNAGTGTTQTDDPDLTVTVPANSTWLVQLQAPYNADPACDIKWGWSGPSGATMNNWLSRWRTMNGTEVSGSSSSISSTQSSTDSAGTLNQGITVQGLLTVGGTGGTFAFQWSQVTANVAFAIIRAGASLRLTRIS